MSQEQETTQICNKTMKQHNKRKKIIRILLPGLSGDDPSPRLGFLRGVFLANHLASTDNLTRTTKKQNTYSNEN